MKFPLILCLLLFNQAIYAIQFSSSEEQATLIELFTSQGCSSCPPADKWLGSLKDHDDLWSKYVPIAWHVDYWDYIGWKDRFARPEFATRQRSYKANGNVNSVYTPGLLKNGKEWRSWFWRKSLHKDTLKVGKLIVTYENSYADIVYQPNDNNKQRFNFNIALLENELSSKINAGENRGKTLQHHFVVGQHKQVQSNKNHVTIPFSFNKNGKQALAVWVSEPDTRNVIQATGTWLD